MLYNLSVQILKIDLRRSGGLRADSLSSTEQS
jgi:hypothetical protein